MTERPILFSAPMVRALIAGRKTQTRRVVKPQPHFDGVFWRWHGGGWPKGHEPMLVPAHSMWNRLPARPGDLLWVREAHAFLPKTAYALPKAVNPGDPDMAAYYREGFDRSGKIIWRPSIHMPRWASRITLEVTEVRVQRLNEISEEDARAEGMIYELPTEDDLQWAKDNEYEMGPDDGVWIAPGTRKGWGMSKEDRAQPQWGPTAAFAFRMVWENIHGPDAWAANPWCCCITFKRVK